MQNLDLSKDTYTHKSGLANDEKLDHIAVIVHNHTQFIEKAKKIHDGGLKEILAIASIIYGITSMMKIYGSYSA